MPFYLHKSNQSSFLILSLIRSDNIGPVFSEVVSSAKKNDIRFVQLGKSFMYKGNSIGPSKFPYMLDCWCPHAGLLMFFMLDCWCPVLGSILTRWLLIPVLGSILTQSPLPPRAAQEQELPINEVGPSPGWQPGWILYYKICINMEKNIKEKKKVSLYSKDVKDWGAETWPEMSTTCFLFVR